MKRFIYLVSAAILGILLGFLLHALVEICYAQLLFWRFDIFGLGLDWAAWFAIHTVFSMITFLGGAMWGLYNGRIWWQKIYINKEWHGIYGYWKNKSMLH